MSDIEAKKTELTNLNIEIGDCEQGGTKFLPFFNSRLSDQLIFRRASGKVVGKWDSEGFLANLKNNPFSSRHTEDVSVTLLDDHALVTLIVVAKRADDESVHRYRNIRLFSRSGEDWVLVLWYNYEI